MCDGLSRNLPDLTEAFELILANCMAHARRQFVDVAPRFPEECRYVLETLHDVHRNDADSRRASMSPNFGDCRRRREPRPGRRPHPSLSARVGCKPPGAGSGPGSEAGRWSRLVRMPRVGRCFQARSGGRMISTSRALCSEAEVCCLPGIGSGLGRTAEERMIDASWEDLVDLVYSSGEVLGTRT